MIAAAVLAAALTHLDRTGELFGPRSVTFTAVDKADTTLPILFERDAIAVRGNVRIADNEMFSTSLEFSDGTRLFRVPVPDWTSAGCHNDPDLTISVQPFGSSGIAIGRHVYECAMNVKRDIESMLFIDMRHPELGVELDFETSQLSGYQNAALLSSNDATTCDWREDDFLCSQVRTVEGDWAKFPSARRFSLLQGKSLPVLSDIARRVRSFAELAKMKEAPEEVVLVENAGVLMPLMRVGVNGEIYASVEKPDAFTATFYLVADHKIVAAAAADIMDVAHGKPPVSKVPADTREAMPFTRLYQDAQFDIALLRKRGNGGLYSVLMAAGSQRALFWVALDPAHLDSFAAIRMASTAGDGQEKYRVVPASMLSYDFNRVGTARVSVANKWYDGLFGQEPTCCLTEDEKTTPAIFDGTVAWTPLGFEVDLRPRETPASRVAVTISLDGTIGSRPLKSDDR